MNIPRLPRGAMPTFGGTYAAAPVPPGHRPIPGVVGGAMMPTSAHHPYAGLMATVAAPAPPPPAQPIHVQQLMEQQMQEELRKNAKRAANRRSASTCRARKKVLVETMAEANERMRKRSRVLSLLPDMILAMRRDGVITYATENCRQFLKYTREEVEGCNIFDLVEAGCHDRLRRLMEENLGTVSKEAIESALRFQGITFQALLARSERAREQGDSSFFSASGEPPRPSAESSSSSSSSSRSRSTAVGGAAANGGGSSLADSADWASTDGGESEVNSNAKIPMSVGSTSRGGGGSGGSGWESATTTTGGEGGYGQGRPKRKLLPSLGPAVFSSAKRGSGSGIGGEKFAAKSEAVAAGATADGGVATSVDRDLQSKINAFTNNRREICKLEIVRQDKKSDWYEVRSSMRLVWLKNKQEIVPVEVICSFQQMHGDGPPGSANSIVNRLQRAAAVVHRPLPASNSAGDSSQSMSGFSVSAGSSNSGTSVASSEGDHHTDSGARSSSEYRGGVSSASADGSGSGSADGSAMENDEDDREPRLSGNSTAGTDGFDVIRPPKRTWGGEGGGDARGGEKQSFPGALKGLAEVAAAAAAAAEASKATTGERRSTGGTRDGGLGDVGPAAVVDASAEVMAPTARRLAMSAKKTLLLRHHHGFDGSTGAQGE